MFVFQPKHLAAVAEQVREWYPLPQEIAFRPEKKAADILQRMREGGGSFFELTAGEFLYVYQLASFCTGEELSQLQLAVSKRMSSSLFETGWIYGQLHANDQAAVSLFVLACNWMRRNQEEKFGATLVGRTGLPWEDIYRRAVDLLRIEKLPLADFCEKYHILPDTVFCRQFYLTYLARCDKSELLEQTVLLAELIAAAQVDFLRPALKNYTANITYDEMPPLVADAISARLAEERDDEAIGLSPAMLQRLRTKRFGSILENLAGQNLPKLQTYQSVVGNIKQVRPLPGDFFAIDFGTYIVLDSARWYQQAFAYLPARFEQLFHTWEEEGHPADYWPAAGEAEIPGAHDVVLGLAKAGCVRLLFAGFDLLYTKDLLTGNR